MAQENHSEGNDFLIVGFSDLHHLQVPMFVSFLLIYILILSGNLLIMIAIYSNAHLHTPMYFFLTNLSFIDISCTSVIFPPMLFHFFQDVTHISLTQCLVQLFFFFTMVATEILLLAVMAYDRYVAICNPLRYVTTMNRVVCCWLASGSWIFGVLESIPFTAMLSEFSFCQSRTIDHFFCDVTALINISCTNTHSFETLIYIMGTVVTMTTFGLIIMSYTNIASSVFKIKSRQGKQKAFSTCSSHLTVIILFYGSLFFTYMRPSSMFPMAVNKIMSLGYLAITPLCNPIIYTLKNTQFKRILQKKCVKHRLASLVNGPKSILTC